tara:strand:- start:1552 stop:1719 length:168 start_codon:yes stop_codon:yes gene_type:complete
MARDIFGNKKIRDEDRMSGRHSVTDSDVRMEYVKGAIWLILGYLYFHFIIMGWTL